MRGATPQKRYASEALCLSGIIPQQRYDAEALCLREIPCHTMDDVPPCSIAMVEFPCNAKATWRFPPFHPALVPVPDPSLILYSCAVHHRTLCRTNATVHIFPQALIKAL